MPATSVRFTRQPEYDEYRAGTAVLIVEDGEAAGIAFGGTLYEVGGMAISACGRCATCVTCSAIRAWRRCSTAKAE